MAVVPVSQRKYGSARKKSNRFYAALPTRSQIETMRDTYSSAIEAGLLPKIAPISDSGAPLAEQQMPAPEIALGTLDVAVGRVWRSLIEKLPRR